MLSTDLQESAPAAESLHVVQSCWPDATLTSCNKLCEQCNPAPTIKQAWSLFLPSHTLHPSPPVRSVTLTHFSTGRLNFRMQLFHHAVFFFFLLSSPEKQPSECELSCGHREKLKHEFKEFGDFLRTLWITTTTCDHEERSEEEEEEEEM